MTGTDLPRVLPELLPRLWAFALRISGNRHDAEDLVQRTCLRALERQHQLKPDSNDPTHHTMGELMNTMHGL